MKTKTIVFFTALFILSIFFYDSDFSLEYLPRTSLISLTGESMGVMTDNKRVLCRYNHKDMIIMRNQTVTVNVAENGGKKVTSTINKRVIGLPGDTLMFYKEDVYINGIKDTYNFSYFLSTDSVQTTVKYHDEVYDITEEPISFTLEDDEYYVLGDYRNNSADSRKFGEFNREDIAGIDLYTAILPF